MGILQGKYYRWTTNGILMDELNMTSYTSYWMVEGGYLRFLIDYSPWTAFKRLPGDQRLKWPLLMKSHTLRFGCGDAFYCMRGRRRMPGALHRVDWSLLINLRKMTKPWFRTTHWPHTAVGLPASVVKECIGHEWHVAPSEKRMSWVISHRSPVGYVHPRSSCCLVG